MLVPPLIGVKDYGITNASNFPNNLLFTQDLAGILRYRIFSLHHAYVLETTLSGPVQIPLLIRDPMSSKFFGSCNKAATEVSALGVRIDFELRFPSGPAVACSQVEKSTQCSTCLKA